MKCRTVTFELRSKGTVVASGCFAVSPERGVSVFPLAKDQGRSTTDAEALFFAGVVIAHSLLEDGTISMSLDGYSIERAGDSPLGFQQQRLLKAGISMGADSGEGEGDSVMLGEDHELFFRTQKVA